MGNFVKRVRQGKVASPTTPKWSAEDWRRAFEAAHPSDDADRRLFAAGNWFSSMLAAYRELAPELGTFGLSHDELVRAAVAGANRNWLILSAAMIPSGEAGDVVVSEHLMSKRFKIEAANADVDPEGLIEAAVDSVRHIIFSSASPAVERAGVAEIVGGIHHRSLVASVYLLLESLWKDCLWNSWAVFESTEVDIVQPTDLRQAAAKAAATFRGHTLRFARHENVKRSWRTLTPGLRAHASGYKVVKEVRRSNRRWDILSRRHAADEMSGAHAMHMSGVGSWMDHLIDRALPELAPLTPWLLLKAWDFVRSLSDAAEKRMPEDTSVDDLSKLWSFAPLFYDGVLAASIANALGISMSTARKTLDVLTIGQMKNKDPWLAPLWRQGKRYLVLHPVASSANPRRMIEHWLTIGGVDLGIRGPLFEKHVRHECADAIFLSPVLGGHAQCAVDGVQLDPSIGDIDLVCQIGNAILIGEIKCTTVPASPVDRANYLRILNEAAEQVRRKLAHARENVSLLSAATGWALEAPSFVGVVITDQELGVGQLIDDVPVVDHEILLKYFRNPVLEHGVTFSPDGQKSVTAETRFYRTIREAEENLKPYLMAPPQLLLALRHLTTTEAPLVFVRGVKPAIHRDFAVNVFPGAEIEPVVG